MPALRLHSERVLSRSFGHRWAAIEQAPIPQLLGVLF